MTAGRTSHALAAARAALHEFDGAHEQAARLFEEAAVGWEAWGFVLGRGEALLGAGRCLLAIGRTDAGRERLTDARAIFAGLSAQPLLARVDALLGDAPLEAARI